MDFGYHIHRCWCRLCRIGHSRGFGIQSPFAYQMVTDVLCQTNPYYLYDDLKSLFPQLGGLRLRICKMLLRLSNAQQSAETYFDDGLPKEYMAYVKAGNRKGSSFLLPMIIVVSSFLRQGTKKLLCVFLTQHIMERLFFLTESMAMKMPLNYGNK